MISTLIATSMTYQMKGIAACIRRSAATKPAWEDMMVTLESNSWTLQAGMDSSCGSGIRAGKTGVDDALANWDPPIDPCAAGSNISASILASDLALRTLGTRTQ
jgi:hypothetical protein